MKWRCEWCGKPHERNDPPCDDCGHHSFERAVVPKAPEAGQEDYVWVCPECDRVHPRNAPPCSRCGNMQLEKRSTDYIDPGEIGGGGWRDAVEWWHVGVAAVGVVLAVLLALGFVGAIDLPGFESGPSVSNVPGSADSVGGHALTTVEAEFVASLNDARSERGGTPLERDQRLGEAATYYNQRLVKSTYPDSTPIGPGQALAAFDYECEELVPLVFTWGPRDRVASAPSEAALADAMVGDLLGNGTLGGSPERIGVDVHGASSGTLVVTVFAC